MTLIGKSVPDGRAWKLHFENLSKRYGPEILFKDLSFRIGPGDAVRLRGPNGAGKTQLLLCLAGFVGPDSGQVELHQCESRRRLRATPWHRDPILRFVPGLPGSIRALEVALAVHALARDLSPFSLANARKRAAASFAHRKPLLEDWLSERVMPDRRMSALSIGQQKRLMLASVLLGPRRPLAFLVDEPLAGLDRHGIEMVMRLFGEARDEGVALLVAEHRSDIEALSFDAEVSLPHRRNALTGPRPSVPARSDHVATNASMVARAPSLLEIRDAVVGYPQRRIACKRLSIAPGELVLIEGNNGSGKTGFLKGLLAIPPAALTGEILLDGSLVGSLASAQAEGRVRYMDQARQSFDGLRTTEALQVAAPAGVAPPAMLGDAVAMVGTRKRVSDLSAGNRAMLTLCQTLATRPALAVLDEPFANVDATSRQRMVAVVERAREEWGTAFLIVEHTGEQLPGARRLRIEGEHEVGAPPRLAAFSPLASMEDLR